VTCDIACDCRGLWIAARNSARSLGRTLASELNYGRGMMNRLDNIAARQKRTRVRDLVFAALVVVAGAISISSVHAATQVVHSNVAQR